MAKSKCLFLRKIQQSPRQQGAAAIYIGVLLTNRVIHSQSRVQSLIRGRKEK